MDIALFGIDALDPELVEEWRDDLPTFADLLNRGGFGRLRSSDPPLSIPAWPTLYTGKQGGKHGVFGFTKRKEDSYERVPVNYTDVMAEPLWEALDYEGFSCAVVNVPLTHPPDSLDHGFVISGWPTPNRAIVSSKPTVLEDIEQAIDEPYRVSPYPLTLEFDELRNDELFKQIREGLWHHQRAFEHVLEEYEVDVFFGVSMALDIASHNFAWDREYLRRMYVEQDRALGELLERLPNRTDVVVLSDHGHGARSSWSFHTNEWLRQEGYLSVDTKRSTGIVEKLGVTQKNYVRIKNVLSLGELHSHLPDSLYRLAKQYVPRGDGGESFDVDAVDWSDTKAHSGEMLTIDINDQSESQGIVENPENVTEKLREELLAVEHPEREGDTLVTNVETKNELFEGPYVDLAPDLVFVLDEMQCNAPTSLTGGPVFTEERWGEHRQHGVLLTAGPSFDHGSPMDDRRITDILPLVLSLVGAEIPDDIDGEIPQERFVEPVEPTYRPSRDDEREEQLYSSEESQEIREQLEGLGYLE